MGTTVESNLTDLPDASVRIRVRLLGPITVERSGIEVTLAASRKVRALLAYLALSPRPVSRSRLCELLWDGPSDPRGELRWCLSKLRRLLNDGERRRVAAGADAVQLDLADCYVDALEVTHVLRDGIDSLDANQLSSLAKSFTGEFLEGLELDSHPEFNAWVTAERRHFRSRHLAVVERLAVAAAGDEALAHIDRWLQLAPFDSRAHELMLKRLVQHGRLSDGEKHLAVAARRFEDEGLDATPLHDLWREVRSHASGGPQMRTPTARDAAPPAVRRASIAVMPFTDGSNERGGYADGLAHDVITRLAKLRSLFVIAQGSVFALRERGMAADDAGRALNVDYVVTGAVTRRGERLTISVELAETRTARILWAEVFTLRHDDAFVVLDEIGNRIVASIASEIETAERNRAILKPPSSLDAWEAHHRGLWHMYRFDKAENERARHFFEMAVRLDPTFARAYAGLSFAHFQNAFQGWAPRAAETDRAYAAAGQSLMADDRDPAAHWAMGRALWLRGRQDQSVIELEKAVDLSPNFALGYYALAFVKSQAGDARAAIEHADLSRNLSPFDPMLFAVLGARAMALVRLGQFAEAAECATKAAARPNAHVHILGIAAGCLALAGLLDEARVHVASIHALNPQYRLTDFLSAFRFDSAGEASFRRAAERIGMA